LDGEEIWFLDGDGNEVRVESIEKVDYSGKIYDVDVGNDVVLVRRGNRELVIGNRGEAPLDSLRHQTGQGVWSGNSNDGTIVDAVFNLTGGVNESGGFEFDGDGDYVDLSSTIVPQSNYTISTWINLKSYDGEIRKAILDQYIVGQAGRMVFWIRSDGSPSYSLNGGESDFDSNIQLNQWYHLVVIDNSTDLLYYMDGVADGNGTRADVYQGTSTKISYYNGLVYDFNGSIDDVLIFNRSLSATEISTLYNESVAKHNVPYYTDYQNISSGVSSIFSVDDEADFVFADFKFLVGLNSSDSFYSPLIFGDVVVTGYDYFGPPSGNRFRITNSSGDCVASIDDKGDMYLMGTVSQSQGSLVAPASSFVLQNSSGGVVDYFNSTGSLFMLGTVSINSDLSGMTSGNVEFRNSTNDLVAFFDNAGNLKLKGAFAENYGSP